MKILQVIQKPQLRGAEIFTCQLSSHLEKLNHKVIVVSLFLGEADLPFKGEQIHFGLNPKFRWFDFKGFKRLANLIDEKKPDIIQANAGDTLKYTVLSKLLYGWQQSIIFRNASMVSSYIRNPIIKFLNRCLYRNVDGIASVSKHSKVDLQELFPFLGDKIRVIPIGTEIKQITPLSLSHYPYLLHVGGFSFEKNHTGLVKIFELLLQHYPKAYLGLVGDGPLKSAVQELVNQKGLSKNIEFHGYQENPLTYVSAAHVFVLPSLIEGLPGVILESFYCKTPVVAYNVGGISELIENGKTGWLVDKQDEESFVSAVCEVLNDDDNKVNKICENAYQNVINLYDNKVIAQRFVEFYNRVLNKGE